MSFINTEIEKIILIWLYFILPFVVNEIDECINQIQYSDHKSTPYISYDWVQLTHENIGHPSLLFIEITIVDL